MTDQEIQTWRQYACAAIQGLLAYNGNLFSWHKDAASLADAMMEEEKKRKEK